MLTVIYLAVLIEIFAGMWKVYVKAGKPGWGCLIPIYNAILLLEMAGKPTWSILLMFIPVVNLVITIIVSMEVAKRFGKSEGFGVGLALVGCVFYPILGYGDAKYMALPPSAPSQM